MHGAADESRALPGQRSSGELQSSASYCKVLHNLGQGPRIVLAWLIVDGPASTPQARGHTGLGLQSEAISGLSWPIGGQQSRHVTSWEDTRTLNLGLVHPASSASNCSELSLTRILSPGDEMPAAAVLPISPNIVWPGSSILSAFVSGPLISMFILHTYRLLFICNFTSINTRYTEEDNRVPRDWQG